MSGTEKKAMLMGSAGLLMLLGLLALIGAGFCAATLHVRRQTGPLLAGAAAVTLAATDGAALKAWWFNPPVSNGGCVIVLHGVGDSRASSAGFAPMFVKEGYSVLAPDSRAHGESGGAFVTYGLLEKYDVAGWAQWMRSQGCQRLYGLGESLGASILIQAAGVESFRAIVAECAFADLRTMAEYRMQPILHLPPLLARPLSTGIVETGLLYARFVDGSDFREVSPLRSVEISSAPILLIHGLDDHRTPPEQSRELAAVRPAKDSLWLVPHAGHTDASVVCPEEFRRRVLGWFASR